MGIFNFKRKKYKYKLGLALGGGGARGFCHIGVLKALEEYGIKPDFVAGTSAGSVVGGVYASGKSIQELEEIGSRLNEKDIRTSKLPFVPSSMKGLENIIKNEIGNLTFDDLKIPFCAVAVDLRSGKEIDIMSGDVAKAITGSCCVPLIFETVIFKDYHLLDGGLLNNIPADVAKDVGCEFVISVDANPGRGYGTDSLKLVDVLAASVRIGIKSNSTKAEPFSDIWIEPDTRRFKSTKLDGREDMIREGYEATMEQMPKILKMLKMKNPYNKKVSFFSRIFKRKKRVEKQNQLEETKDEAIKEKVGEEIDKSEN